MKILVEVLVVLLLLLLVVTAVSMTFMYGYAVFKKWNLNKKRKK
jgi:hypothetical protein